MLTLPLIFAGNPQKIFLKETNFVFIPSGSFTSQETNNVFSIHAFYMLKTEITNLQYREFLFDLKSNNRMEEYYKVLPDTAAWNMNGVNMQAFADHYFSHPAYNNYPVVNISFEAANFYCKWLTEKLKINYPLLNLKNVRLPTSAEWEYAASGGLYGVNYSWGSNYIRNSKGDVMANFLVLGDGCITRTDSGFAIVRDNFEPAFQSDFADVTAPSESYYPNNYGLFNMCGNAAELVYHVRSISDDLNISDTIVSAIGGSWNSPGYDIRISSLQPFEKPNPFTGFRVVITYMNPSTQ